MTLKTGLKEYQKYLTYSDSLTLSQSLLRLSEGFTLFVVYINYHVKTSISYVPYLNSYLIYGHTFIFLALITMHVLTELINANTDDASFTSNVHLPLIASDILRSSIKVKLKKPLNGQRMTGMRCLEIISKVMKSLRKLISSESLDGDTSMRTI